MDIEKHGKIVNNMKVITGKYRGRMLYTLEGRDVIRPTGQKAKEGLFSAIQFKIPGAKVLDLFAGSGQLGIEALSRDASSCVFVDNNRNSANVIRKNLEMIGAGKEARIVFDDAQRFVNRTKEKYDIILMDPPYSLELSSELINDLGRITEEDGMVLCETEEYEEMPETAGELVLRKKYKYGRTLVWLYDKNGGSEE